MVKVGTGTAGEAVTKRNYPVTEGLEAGTQKQEGSQENLIPTTNLTRKDLREGL